MSKAKDKRLRRLAWSHGLLLRKSRKVNFTPEDQGGYYLVDPETGGIVYGWHKELTLVEVEEYFTDE